MGRYAFFNTGFEYKFRFGVQPSEDIRTFGGRMCHEKYEGGDFHHEWEKRDKKYILEELEPLRESLCIEPIDFEQFEKTVEGTYELSNRLYSLLEKNTVYYEDVVLRFRLGSLIYHQLLYTDKLSAHYELY
jgi:hypothetical protein